MSDLDAAVNRRLALAVSESVSTTVVAGRWNAQPTLTTPAFLAGVAISSAIVGAYNAGANAG